VDNLNICTTKMLDATHVGTPARIELRYVLYFTTVFSLFYNKLKLVYWKNTNEHLWLMN